VVVISKATYPLTYEQSFIQHSSMNIGSLDFLNQQNLPSGALYMVATPIGNLGDITLRALHVLNAVDGIACEDTRHSAALLQQFGIHKKCLALHEHNEIEGAQSIIQSLHKGERWAYISDAGTPGVSDPGARLVHEVHKAGCQVIPVPGPSALACAISAAGDVMLNSEGRFQFLGFWPNKAKDRDAWLKDVSSSKKASVFFESPHHIRETLTQLSNGLEADRTVFICRELTKKFEQLARLSASEIPSWLENAESLKGEFVVLVSGRDVSTDEAPEHASLLLWANALSPFLASKEIASVLSQVLGIAKKEAYQAALSAKEKRL
jgi:16S rRNA (cytidine1402-2'-O)-methyltransferase